MPSVISTNVTEQLWDKGYEIEVLQVFQWEILQDVKGPRQLIILHVPTIEEVEKKGISLGKQRQKNNITKGHKRRKLTMKSKMPSFSLKMVTRQSSCLKKYHCKTRANGMVSRPRVQDIILIHICTHTRLTNLRVQ